MNVIDNSIIKTYIYEKKSHKRTSLLIIKSQIKRESKRTVLMWRLIVQKNISIIHSLLQSLQETPLSNIPSKLTLKWQTIFRPFNKQRQAPLKKGLNNKGYNPNLIHEEIKLNHWIFRNCKTEEKLWINRICGVSYWKDRSRVHSGERMAEIINRYWSKCWSWWMDCGIFGWIIET